ncbi:MAG: hypothetical protein ACO26C_02865 [Ilumatobacteraceae bacterium]
MLVALDPAAALAASAAAWLLAGIAVGASWARASDARVLRSRAVLRLRRWESREAYRRATGVHRWKRWVPDAGAWFGGRRKRLGDDAGAAARARLHVEVVRAEMVHWTMLALSPAWLVWSRGWVLAINAAVAIAINVPCLVVARSTRARLAAVA